MDRLLWDDVKDWFDPWENGSAPDVIVADTDLADWNRLFELIRSRGWRCLHHHVDGARALPASPEELLSLRPAEAVTSLTVWPYPDLEWIIRPRSVGEIVSDVDLHQIQGQQRLDQFCRFLADLGRALGKRVAVYSEGTSTGGYPPLMAYEVADDRVHVLAGPWSQGRAGRPLMDS